MTTTSIGNNIDLSVVATKKKMPLPYRILLYKKIRLLVENGVVIASERREADRFSFSRKIEDFCIDKYVSVNEIVLFLPSVLGDNPSDGEIIDLAKKLGLESKFKNIFECILYNYSRINGSCIKSLLNINWYDSPKLLTGETIWAPTTPVHVVCRDDDEGYQNHEFTYQNLLNAKTYDGRIWQLVDKNQVPVIIEIC